MINIFAINADGSLNAMPGLPGAPAVAAGSSSASDELATPVRRDTAVR